MISSRNHYPLDNSPWPLLFQTLEASSIVSGFYEFSHCLSMYSHTIFACMHVCMCVLNACVYMWSEINIKCLITSFFTLFKNKASPGDPKLALLARLTSQRASGILLSLPFLPLFPLYCNYLLAKAVAIPIPSFSQQGLTFILLPVCSFHRSVCPPPYRS